VKDKAVVREVERPQLNAFNFVVWRKGERGEPNFKCESLIAYIDNPRVGESGAQVRGVVSHDPDFAEALIQIHQAMTRQANAGE
jgi:hypothetical protein